MLWLKQNFSKKQHYQLFSMYEQHLTHVHSYVTWSNMVVYDFGSDYILVPSTNGHFFRPLQKKTQFGPCTPHAR